MAEQSPATAAVVATVARPAVAVKPTSPRPSAGPLDPEQERLKQERLEKIRCVIVLNPLLGTACCVCGDSRVPCALWLLDYTACVRVETCFGEAASGFFVDVASCGCMCC